MMRGTAILMAAVLCGMASARAEVKLAGLFTDSMVLQRDAKAPVWGTAAPGEAITLSLDGRQATATAGPDGKWAAAFQNLKAGGPFDLAVSAPSGSVTIHDVLVGEVWVCSGQSNMEYQLRDADEVAAPDDPQLRQFLVPKSPALAPQAEIGGKAAWVAATPANRPKFTAVGYYFGRKLRAETGVPIGLIHSSWGGTACESWMPREAIDSIPELKARIAPMFDAWNNLDADAAKFPADLAAWEKRYGPLDPGNKENGWADPALDVSDWKKLGNAGDWTGLGVPNGGVVWIRRVVPIPADKAGKDLRLNLDVVSDLDTAYFNGEEVGHGGMEPPYFWGGGRSYTVPSRLVKAGDNVLAVRVVSRQEKNGLFGFANRLGLGGIDPTTIPAWSVKVEAAFPPRPAEALAALPKPPTVHRDWIPTILYNGMIRPLIPYGIKGAIWYQGEANAGRGYNYRTVFPAMIRAWRERWGQGDFPFYFVQLADLGGPPKKPDNPGWSQVRESQLMTWKKVPNTGMAVVADVGDHGNLHPPDKKDVGERLARIALANLYGKKIEYSGPVYDSMAVEGGKIRLKFSHVGAGLVSGDGGPLKTFQIAGADQNFVWADAAIDGDSNSVVVSSPDVPAPAAVRYAWSANPEGLNLFNKDGLPASPFRTDEWPSDSNTVWWWWPAP